MQASQEGHSSASEITFFHLTLLWPDQQMPGAYLRNCWYKHWCCPGLQWTPTFSHFPLSSFSYAQWDQGSLLHKVKGLYYLKLQRENWENNLYLDLVINGRLSKPQWLLSAEPIILSERLSLSQQTSVSDWRFWLTTARAAVKVP